jgi:hypothetical protein
MERKASDVLLELERKVDLILGYLKTIDLNNKLILNRLNRDAAAGVVASSPPPKPSGLPRAEAFVDSSKSTLPSLPTMPERKVSGPPLTFLSVSSDSGVEDPTILKQEIQLELQPKGQRRDIRTPLEPDKKVPVSQKVLYPDGKAVVLANVEIYNSAKELLKKTRTNNVGKWAATLDPGKYTIRVQKTGTNEKPAVERSFEVDIPVSEGSVDLNVLQ